jgi:uncharacterized protein
MTGLIVISISALLASLLTFYSGFGLGTVLTPVFILFFPVEAAIALTGVVHFLNNLFKLGLTRRSVDRTVALRFGIPAFLAAIPGALLLHWLSDQPVLCHYSLAGRTFQITPLKLIISLLLAGFAVFEVLPSFRNLQFGRDKLLAGGVLSGFFGGLSGHQGALRSAFLLKTGLSVESFIATGVVIACLVDLSRLGVYSTRFIDSGLCGHLDLLASASISAFAGAWIGNRLLKKVTIHVIQTGVSILLFAIALALGLGII